MMLSLSFNLSSDTPFYDGLAKPTIERLYDLSRGDTCNSFYFRSSNHCGTHVDAPWHFNRKGRKITEYQPDELVFNHPAILDAPVGRGHLIAPADLEGAALPAETDILLLRTGFGVHRPDGKTYIYDAPGFSRAAAEYVLRSFPALRALAMDIPSLSASNHAHEGAEAHRVFLGCEGYSDRTVLLVEDARLPPELTTPSRVLIVPWMIDGLDSAPCSLLAEYAE